MFGSVDAIGWLPAVQLAIVAQFQGFGFGSAGDQSARAFADTATCSVPRVKVLRSARIAPSTRVADQLRYLATDHAAGLVEPVHGAFHFHAWITLLRDESCCYALFEHDSQQLVVDVAFKGAVGEVPVDDLTVCRRIQGIENAFAHWLLVRQEIGHTIRVHAGHPFDVRVGKQELVAVVLQELVIGHVEKRAFRAQLVEERHNQSEPVSLHDGILVQSDLVMATFGNGLCHTFQENLVECYCGAAGFLQRTSGTGAHAEFQQRFQSESALDPIEQLTPAGPCGIALQYGFVFAHPCHVRRDESHDVFVVVRIAAMVVVVLAVEIFGEGNAVLVFLAHVVHGGVAQGESPGAGVEHAGSVGGVLHTVGEHDGLAVVVEGVSGKLGEHHTDLRGGSHTDHGNVLFAAAERTLIVFAVAGYKLHAPSDHGYALLSTGRAFTFRGFEMFYGLFLHACIAEPDHGSVVGMRVKNIIHGAGLQSRQRIVGMVGEILVVERSWVTHADTAVFAGKPNPCGPSAITAVNHRHAGLEVVFGQFDDRTVVDAPFLRGDVGNHAAKFLDP